MHGHRDSTTSARRLSARRLSARRRQRSVPSPILYLSLLLPLLLSPLPSPPSALPAPPAQLSLPYRNWTYYNPPTHGGFVVPPLAGGFAGQTLTDTAVVFERAPEDALPGRYRMTYLWYNGTKGGNGYEVGLALSDDLLTWTFGQGGDAGLVFARNPVPGSYDYGGVTLGGMLWQNASLRSPRRLQKRRAATTVVDGGGASKYYALYGCYPSRGGYEQGSGGQGMAVSDDGVSWSRLSDTVPVTAGASASSAPWENREVYQPFLLENNGTFYDFYNAAGTNQYGASAEESGIANLPAAEFPGLAPGPASSAAVSEAATSLPSFSSSSSSTSQWKLNPLSPVIASGPKGSCDTAMASDPKVFWDEKQV